MTAGVLQGTGLLVGLFNGELCCCTARASMRPVEASHLLVLRQLNRAVLQRRLMRDACRFICKASAAAQSTGPEKWPAKRTDKQAAPHSTFPNGARIPRHKQLTCIVNQAAPDAQKQGAPRHPKPHLELGWSPASQET